MVVAAEAEGGQGGEEEAEEDTEDHREGGVVLREEVEVVLQDMVAEMREYMVRVAEVEGEVGSAEEDTG